MVQVEKIWEGVRGEGLNYGLPTVFIKLGLGQEFASTMELVREVMLKCQSKWACILGEGTTQVGMGTLIKGLSAIGTYVEVECDGGVRDPGWAHSVDRWVVDYSTEPLFNYSVLRSADMIRFIIRNEKDLAAAKLGFDQLRVFAGTKYFLLTEGDVPGALEFIRKYDRSRIYWVKEEHKYETCR